MTRGTCPPIKFPDKVICLKCSQPTDRGMTVTYPQGGVICPKCMGWQKPLEHTPGPWEYGLFEGKDRYKGFYVNAPQTSDDADLAWRICDVQAHYNNREIQEANARLIAAAPGLLAACKKLAEWDKSHDDAELISEACSMARSAIAKAKGG